MTDEPIRAGARNPKIAKFTVSLAADINQRLEHLSDLAGANKGVMASMCISAGLNMLERVYLVGVEAYVQQAVKDKSNQLVDDVNQASQS